MIAACLALSGAFPVAPAGASSLRVTPIRVTMPLDRRFCSLTLANDGDTPVSVQIRGYDWDRSEDGEDILTESGAIRVNPGIVTLPAHGAQLIRCAVPEPTWSGTKALPMEKAPPVEQAWRLVFDELPPPAGLTPGGTILTLLRISVPVFRGAPGLAPHVIWSQRNTADGAPALVLENTGTAHAQIRSVNITTDPAAAAPQAYEQGFYLLPKGRLVIPLPAGFAAPHSARITGVTVQSPEGPLTVVPAR
ncbi:molecular chaperone [Novosphingobium sp. 9]|uniref:fimbrial biogenesis chaperone n=1 Tax=Novosphingobium sp. 9 TaxID=2025349 RepID=UPI0021B4D671|nr:fimbria/pilus periplasmic chaperone [Novosphingobium sp. 9]